MYIRIRSPFLSPFLPCPGFLGFTVSPVAAGRALFLDTSGAMPVYRGFPGLQHTGRQPARGMT